MFYVLHVHCFILLLLSSSFLICSLLYIIMFLSSFLIIIIRILFLSLLILLNIFSYVCFLYLSYLCFSFSSSSIFLVCLYISIAVVLSLFAGKTKHGSYLVPTLYFSWFLFLLLFVSCPCPTPPPFLTEAKRTTQNCIKLKHPQNSYHFLFSFGPFSNIAFSRKMATTSFSWKCLKIWGFSRF